MARLIYSMSVSLDGFVEAPSHDLGWAIMDEELHRYPDVGALMLALTLPAAERPRLAGPPLSPDGRWWWDGHAWQPMPPGSAERAGDRGAS